MANIDDEELNKIVSAARKARGGKPAKYQELEKYAESIEKLIDNDVQLPFILKWLLKEKGEKLVLNTLRKFVIRKIGRDRYEQYLARNGWQKSKRSKPTGAAEKVPAAQKMTPVETENAGTPFTGKSAKQRRDEVANKWCPNDSEPLSPLLSNIIKGEVK